MVRWNSRYLKFTQNVDGRLEMEIRYLHCFGTQGSNCLISKAMHFGAYLLDWIERSQKQSLNVSISGPASRR